jgi:DNA invertase Pin-like site-specific DNA recombinase
LSTDGSVLVSVKVGEYQKYQTSIRLAPARHCAWLVDHQVVIIDKDQGQSGKSSADREGFQHLVAEVSLERAGIVLGLEVSRLARNSSDWHRLLEICAVTNTLVIDDDGLYDPTDFNDRLLLGLRAR